MARKDRAGAPGVPQIVGEYEIVDVAKIHEHPRNPNNGDDPTVRALIRKHGFRGVIEVQRSSGSITAGNTRYRSAVAEGMPRVPVTWTDDDDATALERVLGDNRARDLALWDDQALTEVLAEIRDTTGTLDGTGFDEATFDQLYAEITGSNEPPAPASGDGTPVAGGAVKQLRLLVVPVPVDAYDPIVDKLNTARDTWQITIGEALARILGEARTPTTED
jgi:hypothetical protein